MGQVHAGGFFIQRRKRGFMQAHERTRPQAFFLQGAQGKARAQQRGHQRQHGTNFAQRSAAGERVRKITGHQRIRRHVVRRDQNRRAYGERRVAARVPEYDFQKICVVCEDGLKFHEARPPFGIVLPGRKRDGHTRRRARAVLRACPVQRWFHFASSPRGPPI